MKRSLYIKNPIWCLVFSLISSVYIPASGQNNLNENLIPVIDGDWWQVSGDPDLGSYTTPKQQPVDFAIWQAFDGTWQILSCIRGTKCGGKNRLLYRWQGSNIKDHDWHPMGIFMEADTSFGETLGGLQAPYVMKIENEYYMFYGDFANICIAKGVDGKTFARQLNSENRSGVFSEGSGNNTRDVMVIRKEDLFYAYYTASQGDDGYVFVRSSRDLKSWSPSKVVAYGGSAGFGKNKTECPFVYFHEQSGFYYLFRTQRYGLNAQTMVYRSKDLMDFGVNDDWSLVTMIPVAAPEIFESEGQLYIAALMNSLKGIMIAKLKFVPKDYDNKNR